jgi:predicted kinase
MQVANMRKRADGALVCADCGTVLVKSFNPQANNNKHAIVFHHEKELNNQNCNDASISLNCNLITILCWKCHNIRHNRFVGGAVSIERKVYLITGAPCSGKTTFAREHMQAGDLILDIDDLWHTLSGQPRYTKPNALKAIVFQLRRDIKAQIAAGAGTWRNAFIIESLPIATDRKREVERYRAHNCEVITMDATQEECLQRLYANPSGRDIKAYEEYIAEYFADYTGGVV